MPVKTPRHILDQPQMVELRALRDLGVGQRNADAAAEIAGDVDERGRLCWSFPAAVRCRRPR